MNATPPYGATRDDAGRHAERSRVDAAAEQHRAGEHEPRGGGAQLAAAAREPDERDRDDAEAVEELKLHRGLEAAQRLRVGERQRVAADGARDRRHEQRGRGGGEQHLRLLGHRCGSMPAAESPQLTNLSFAAANGG